MLYSPNTWTVRLLSIIFLGLLSIVVSPVWAQQTLENPQPDSFQSGVGVISGWACNANTIEISFNGGPRFQAALGTIREDTQSVCGDTDNGFGLLYNWNRLGDGAHTVTAYADGVEFASAQVTVTTLGEEFLRGASGTVTVSDFPTPGETRMLRWQQAQQNFVITAGSPQGGGTSGAAPHVLENPQPGSFQSGVGVISGWACDAQTIEISFDGGPRIQAGTGTIREDTQGVCGDTNNGFGLLYNWNRLGDGVHTVTAYADGEEFARVTVTVTTLGEEFRRGLVYEATLPDFPEVGTDTRLLWQQGQQNFVMTATLPTPRLVTIEPSVRLPSGLSIPDLAASSLMSETAEVRASPDPTLLLAEDAGGTVLLALANMDGGLLGEGPGAVTVSVDSTAVTLVGLAAGMAISDMTQSVVETIVRHAQYDALRSALSTQLAADKNFLDRLYDEPEAVRLITEVAQAIVTPPATEAAPWSGSATPNAGRDCSVIRHLLQDHVHLDIVAHVGIPVEGINDGLARLIETLDTSGEYARCIEDFPVHWQALHPLPHPQPPFDTTALVELDAADEYLRTRNQFCPLRQAGAVGQELELIVTPRQARDIRRGIDKMLALVSSGSHWLVRLVVDGSAHTRRSQTLAAHAARASSLGCPLTGDAIAGGEGSAGDERALCIDGFIFDPTTGEERPCEEVAGPQAWAKRMWIEWPHECTNLVTDKTGHPGRMSCIPIHAIVAGLTPQEAREERHRRVKEECRAWTGPVFNVGWVTIYCASVKIPAPNTYPTIHDAYQECQREVDYYNESNKNCTRFRLGTNDIAWKIYTGKVACCYHDGKP